MSTGEPKAIPLRIRLPYRTEEEFTERYGGNVARGGIFIATRAVKPEGTRIRFELVLEDGTRLMCGEGVVQKAQAEVAAGRSGMTLRFARLDPPTKALIDRVLERRAGGPPSTPPEERQIAEAPEPPPSAAAPAPAAVRAKPPESQPEESPGEGVAAAPAVPAAPAPAAPASSLPSPAPSAPRRRSLPELPVPTPRASTAAEHIVGIDLGTTNSRVAVFRDGAASLLPVDEQGHTSLPSVVGLDADGQWYVGRAALDRLGLDPENTVFGSKRFLGRRMRSKAVQSVLGQLPFRLVPDEAGDVGADLQGRTVSLSEVSAQLLARLKAAAESALGQKVERAVLCVPAYFSDHQRAAVLEAARRAGLEVARLLNEPSATALAFGYGRALARKRILVYDLGGGTFDASVVALTGDELEVVTSGGDHFLGGMDFDARIVEQLAALMPPEQREQLSGEPAAALRLSGEAERLKIALSSAESVPVSLSSSAISLGGATFGGATFEVTGELSRTRLEEVTSALVDRTLAVTQAVLEAGSLAAQSLDEVLLVGGQSLAPLVRKRLEAFVGKPPRTDVDPCAAVALGAAIMGHSILLKKAGKAGVTLSEVLTAPIGIGVQGGGMRRILESNTRLPAEKSISLVVREGQPVGIAVFQGAARLAEDNEYLGALHAVPERNGELNLLFKVSPDGRLDLSAVGPLGQRVDVTVTTAEASDATREALWAQAPLPETSGTPPPGGLLKGLKRLFGRD